MKSFFGSFRRARTLGCFGGTGMIASVSESEPLTGSGWSIPLSGVARTAQHRQQRPHPANGDRRRVRRSQITRLMRVALPAGTYPAVHPHPRRHRLSAATPLTRDPRVSPRRRRRDRVRCAVRAPHDPGLASRGAALLRSPRHLSPPLENAGRRTQRISQTPRSKRGGRGGGAPPSLGQRCRKPSVWSGLTRWSSSARGSG